ncbi:hypothetical protein RY831_04595 [Noviherbaspirillum sp. CPCC 100848]|uniref:Cation transporter n=1 Tax=Noviherbaspirillum album TaxID=3080276 RepID=A0ABU6J457_9BURK|nr:hypothetical protein [Noviherbaspirillum sp. CPCC 100848]MEC4718412.1 hypothetical protein [Noviherbaspirillum sp. CPCC 100848]
MVANKPAPIACTLSPAEFKHRAAWIAQLTETALMAHRIHGGTAHLLYRVEAKEAVEQLVRQEQTCCAFLQFEMSETPLGVEVNITAPPETHSDAAALFAHLLPSHKSSVSSDSAPAPQIRGCGCGSVCGS